MDKKQVIKGLESLKQDYLLCKCDTNSNVIDEAIALLNEQEAVEPILACEGWNKHHNRYVCPRCDDDVFYEQNYCTECGVQFLWEGR